MQHQSFQKNHTMMLPMQIDENNPSIFYFSLQPGVLTVKLHKHRGPILNRVIMVKKSKVM